MKLSFIFNKRSLAKFAKDIAITFSLAVGSIFMMPGAIDVARSGSGEKLNRDEVELVNSIFGDQLNTKRVRKHLNEKTKGAVCASVQGASRRHIDFWGKGFHSENYAKDDDAFLYNVFVHEVTHIWQNQNQSLVKNILKHSDVYDYELTDDCHFSDFGTEQQASIVADYAERFLYEGEVFFALRYRPGYLENLKRVVEEQFPAARKTRLAREADKQENLRKDKVQTPQPFQRPPYKQPVVPVKIMPGV